MLKIEASSDENAADEISLRLVNKKLESFVEVILGKMIELQQENRDLRRRISALESTNNRMK